ncbi:hypothetical protein [Shewanella sp. GutDb-MelDb]|uniref:DUF6953 family protein n=1 Tax=Shewanella sp. GutDb-MelDb TaxID=2058316 RepID=UPI000C7D82CA|nr:hypothetical protein [Shewanella sp. GutDb-MelDb]PKG59274.1 hypothetical protein CXF82_00130 [Shewanella sp. GutDb-MelDb]
MDAKHVAAWMQQELVKQNCLYQDDVVDFLVKAKDETHLRENADGNLVLGTKLLNSFKKLNEHDVVWVRSEFYWRPRVAEDEEGRLARG